MTITLDGTTGITTPGLTNTGTETLVNLTTTGNTTLGDATTDTLTVGVTGIVKDASGNVGIGTSSPQGRLHVSGGYAGFQHNSNGSYPAYNTYFRAIGTNFQAGSSYLDFWNTVGSGFQWHIQTAASTQSSVMTIDSSGNVGIGTSSPVNKLEVASGGLYVSGIGTYSATGYGFNTYNLDNTKTILLAYNRTTSAFMDVVLAAKNSIFENNGTERMRIDTSGNLLVGVTSILDAEKFNVTQTASGEAAIISNTSASNIYPVIQIRASRNTTNSTFQAIGYFNAGFGNYRFIVQDSGNVQNSNNSYGAISDVKLKENISDATPKLEQLNRVRIVNYNLKADPEQKQIGVIAQELEQIFPSMVEETVDRDGEGNDLGTTTKSVKYSVFVPMLIKSIQELKSIIDTQASTIQSLTDRLTALEKK